MNQADIEYLIHPKHIKQDVLKEIEESFPKEIADSVSAIHKWLDIQEYESKQTRKEHLRSIDTHKLVLDIFSTVLISAKSLMPLVSIASMVRVDAMSKIDSIKTVCELLAILQHAELYKIENYSGTRYVQSLIDLSESEHYKRLVLSCYLPPMIEKPREVTSNYSSGYHTINDSVILGFTENSHHHRIALDVINTQNQVPLMLDNYVIDNFSKQWHREELTEDELSLLDSDEEIQQYQAELRTWENYQEQYEYFKELLRDRTIYFTNKYDKRGRLYTQGYHFNTQGTSFEKACISLAKTELVTGEL